MSRIEPRPQSPIPLVERPENAPKRRREQRKPPPTDDDEKQRKGPKSPKSQKSRKEPDVDAERNEEELGEPGEKVDVYL
jgi:hypothetical protein